MLLAIDSVAFTERDQREKAKEIMRRTIAFTRLRSLILVVSLIVVAGLVTAQPAQAADFKSGNQIMVGRDQVIDDDLYASANTIVIDGTVQGDVIAFGQQITINGTVDGDLLGAAQVIIINGAVNDDVRIAAQVITLGPSAQIAHGVMAASYSLEQQQGSSVGGDLLYAGYQALLAGTVSRDVLAAAQALSIRGNIGRNVNANVGGGSGAPPMVGPMPSVAVAIPFVPPGLTVDSSARIGGQVTYESRTPGEIRPGAQVQGRVLQAAPPAAAAPVAAATTIADLVFDNVRRFLALLLVGLLLLWVAPRFLRTLADTVQTRPLPSLGWGIVSVLLFIIALIVVVLVTIFLAVLFGVVTLGGLVPPIIGVGALADAALVVGFFIFVGYVAQVVVSYLAGRWIVARLRPGQEPGRLWPFVIGLVVFVILTAIPVLGGLIGLIVALLALGAFWIWLTSRRVPQPTISGAPA